MQNLLNELPQLIVTLALLAVVTILLCFGVIPRDDILVGTILQGVLTFWFLNAAFKYNPNSGGSVPTPAPTLPPAG